MKTSELEGAKLAEWVARTNGWKVEREEGELICWDENGNVYSFGSFGYRPDMEWHRAGPIIERNEISIVMDNGSWLATSPGGCFDWGGFDIKGKGSTALIAAMRAYVASKFGDELPDEVAA